ncbi:MAG: 23S rRNA (pseudouridine(1915)-N(3))-methyltransferase RlmH [Chlamydiae bacterium]|nr:23S rRNA (pseudouridine(1915)-N(3))-methyltransferase RlmH [Chlamydiota bacterium]
MLKMKIFSIGKNKEAWLGLAIAEYEKRLNFDIQWIFLKDDDQLAKALLHEKFIIALDPSGKALTSEEFSKFLVSSSIKEKCLSFVIGGAEGLTGAIKKKANILLSLSKMTFTHQFCRLILIEQIYRALEIEKGTNYHK